MTESETHLTQYGLNARIRQEAAQYVPLHIARVTEQHREIYTVMGEHGDMHAAVSGKFAFQAQEATDFPAVGDWVMVDRVDNQGGRAVIHYVLPRTSSFERKAAGSKVMGQVVAANINRVFICMSLNDDFSLRRLERYLAVAWDSGATPAIVLTKADLCTDLDTKLEEIAAVSVGTEVIVSSGQEAEGARQLAASMAPGVTVAFIGSSGVGKSTLVNRLMGQEVLSTGSIREDDSRGRHTTTHRQLLLLPTGGVVIDTPGMRELQLDSANLERSFEDIERLSEACKYGDCAHRSEPGCAIQAALASGELAGERYDSYRKLQRELSYESLKARQLEHKKLEAMFGGKDQMKQARRNAKHKNKHHY